MTFEVLSGDDIQEIHGATLRVLERTGVKVYSEEARDLLAQAGCRLEDDIVKIPVSALVAFHRKIPGQRAPG